MKSFDKLKKMEVIIFCAIFFIGCAPKAWQIAEQSYKSGDYVMAVRACVASLKEKQNYEKAVTMLMEILPEAQNDLLEQGKQAEQIKDWDNAFTHYSTIAELSKLVKSLPPQTDPKTEKKAVFKILNADKLIENARNNAAEKHYQQGIAWENTKFKEAAKEFTRAQEYIPGYKDARERYEKTRAAAIKRIALMPFENKSGKNQYGSLGETISDNCIGLIMENPANTEFVEMVSRDRLGQLLEEQKLGASGIVDEKTAPKLGKVLGLHSFVFGKVNTVVVTQTPDIVENGSNEAEISQGKGKPTKKVYASYTTTRRQAKSTITISYQIIDVARGTIVKSGSMLGEFNFDWTFARYKGDWQAVPYDVYQLCGREERYAPPADELVNNAVNNASYKLANELAEYFR